MLLCLFLTPEARTAPTVLDAVDVAHGDSCGISLLTQKQDQLALKQQPCPQQQQHDSDSSASPIVIYFPPTVSQSALRGLMGSNACGVIASLVGEHILRGPFQELFVSSQLSMTERSMLVECIVEGNDLYD